MVLVLLRQKQTALAFDLRQNLVCVPVLLRPKLVVEGQLALLAVLLLVEAAVPPAAVAAVPSALVLVLVLVLGWAL
jgi:hypothetical protein